MKRDETNNTVSTTAGELFQLEDEEIKTDAKQL